MNWISPFFKKIVFTFPKYREMRYKSLGDWFFRGGVLFIASVREQGLESAIAVAIHELVETILCNEAGVTQEQVDKFDMTHLFLDDPGLSPDAPYHRQHVAALKVERAFCNAVGLSWKQHEKNMDIAEHCGSPDENKPVPCKVKQNKRMKDM